MNDQLSFIKESLEEIIDAEKLGIEERSLSDYQLCFIIRPGVRGVLDVARKALHETTLDILELSRALSSTAGLLATTTRGECRYQWAGRQCQVHECPQISLAPQIVTWGHFSKPISKSHFQCIHVGRTRKPHTFYRSDRHLPRKS